MNRVVLIGNGFDLAHGLPTSYGDFLQWYANQIVNEISEKGEYEDDLLNLKINSDVDLKRVKGLLLKKGEDFIDFFNRLSPNYQIPQLIRKNLHSFLRYLVNGQSNLSQNWSDFEMIYFNLLKECHLQFQSNQNIRPVINLNKQFNYLILKFVEYLKTFQETVRKTVVTNRMADPFFAEIRDSKTGNTNSPGEIMILDFNITDLIQRKDFYINKPVHHIKIHGYLDDPSSINFGFGDERNSIYKEIEDNNANEFLRYVKSFKYLSDLKYKIAMAFLEKDEFDVRVMGHSCGISDRTLLSHLFNHEKLTKGIHVLHHNGLKSYTETTYEISRCFKDKVKFRDRVQPFDINLQHPQIIN